MCPSGATCLLIDCRCRELDPIKRVGTKIRANIIIIIIISLNVDSSRHHIYEKNFINVKQQ